MHLDGDLMAVIQLALDFINIRDAVDVANKAREYVDWLEAGTPLIKSEGVSAIRELKRLFPEKKIVADMKIMDAGALETELAADAGADVVTVMGASDLSTIQGAIAAGKKRGIKVMVDTMNIDAARVEKIEKLKPDYICPHVGLDQQEKGLKLIDVVAETKIHVPLAVGGGINSETAEVFAKAKVSVIIVGAAITKAEDAGKEAEIIKRAVEKAGAD